MMVTESGRDTEEYTAGTGARRLRVNIGRCARHGKLWRGRALGEFKIGAMNPYASHLGENDPKQVMEQTPGKLSALLRSLRGAVEEAPAPGKWSPREMVAHLADCEAVFAFRIRQTLAEDNPLIQPFDQDKWAAQYAAYDLESALATFQALRHWNVALVKSLKPEDFARKVTHPERGSMTLQTIVETIGGHDINHIRQLEAIAAREATA